MKSRPRIVIDARPLTHPQPGGFRSHVRALTAGLKEIGFDNDADLIFYLDRPPTPEQLQLLPPAATYRVLSPNRLKTDFQLFPAQIRRDAPDLVHGTINYLPPNLAVRTTLTLHDVLVFNNGGLFRRNRSPRRTAMAFYWELMARLAVGRAARIITVSRSAAEGLTLTIGRREPPLAVVYNGIALPPLCRKEPRSANRLLAFAPSDPRKKLWLLLEALGEWREKPPLTLIAADTPSAERAAAGVRKFGLNEVEILRRPDDMEVARQYARAAVFVWTSFHEGFGLPPLEAMRYGCPVVSSANPAMPEILGETPYYFKSFLPDKIMARLDEALSSPKDAAERGGTGAGARRDVHLSADGGGDGGNLAGGVRVSESSEKRPSLLFLADLPPWPLYGGGQIKSYLTLRALSEIAEIHLVTFLRRPEDEANLEALRPFCATIQGFSLPRSLWRNAAAGAWSLLTNESFLMQRNHTAEMSEYVREVLPSGDFDVIHVDHLQMMQFVPDEVGAAKIVLDCHNVEHELVRQTGEAVGEWADIYLRPLYFREAARLKEVEADACRRADLILTVTDTDAARFRELAPENAENVAVVPIGVDTDYFAPISRGYADSRTILFLGTLFWPPNVDALRWFCDAVLPKIQNDIPDVKLLVVGSRPSRDVKDIAMATPAVQLVADATDIRPYAARASAFVAPLRFGGGMRVKTLCAMAMGLPVVATAQGLAGIALPDSRKEFLFGKKEVFFADFAVIPRKKGVGNAEKEIIPDENEGDVDDFALPFSDFALRAEDADAFAAAVVRVLVDREFAEALARNGRNLVKNVYSASVIAARLMAVYRERVL